MDVCICVCKCQGWVGLSFPVVAGRMAPADAVIGWVGSSGVPEVAAYYLTGHVVSQSNSVTGWSTNMGVVKLGQSTIVCFSRPVKATAARAVDSVNTAGWCDSAGQQFDSWMVNSLTKLWFSSATMYCLILPADLSVPPVGVPVQTTTSISSRQAFSLPWPAELKFGVRMSRLHQALLSNEWNAHRHTICCFNSKQ